MQFKPIAAIIVLLVVVASLSVAGCTVQPKVEIADVSFVPYENVGYVSTDYPISGRSQLVEACVKGRLTASNSSVVWQNNTAATVTVNGKFSSGTDYARYYIYKHFPTVAAASAYFDSQRGTYPLKPEKILTGPVNYYSLTGHYPTVYKQLSGPGIFVGDVTGKHQGADMTQYDALVVEEYLIEASPPMNQA